MNKKNIVIGVVIGLLLLIFVAIPGCQYNGWVTKEQGVKKSWANVEAQYQRRTDLIKNLVNTVKGAAANEQKILIETIRARAEATKINLNIDNLTPENIKKFQEAHEGLTGALSKLMMVAEKYPDIKSNENFLRLQTEIEGTENRVTKARTDYNSAVEDYNTSIAKFPGNMMSGMFGFKEKGYFQAQAGSEKAPEVQF